MKKEIRASSILILILAFAFLIVWLFSFWITYISNLNIKILELMSWILIYILLYFLIDKLSSKFKNQFFQYIKLILFLPVLIFLIIGTIIQPILTLIIAIIMFLTIIFLPLLIVSFLQKIYPDIITDWIKLFITLSLWGILAITSVKWILNIIYETNYDTIKKHKMESFIDYVLNKKTIKFLIYLSYFLYIILEAFFILNWENEINLAITHSFFVILAFDSLSQNFVSFLPSKVLIYIMNIRKNSISSLTTTTNINKISSNKKSI